MRDHVEIAIEAGGTAPPVVITLTEDERRKTDCAHVDAGIMPLAEYVRIYGKVEP